ncbi:MAG: tRNA (adenosine(37)-N6)-dimethylallyltransferase MiaA, partial [Chloroflexota bacterium]
SALALSLAPRYRGEIVSADSRQVYRYMDIGTAKPTAQEKALVPHHLVDTVDPDEPYTLAMYQQGAYTAIASVHDRGGLPILVGGTGLYVRAALGGFAIPRVAPNEAVRSELEEYAREKGPEALHSRLAAADPVAAGKIDPRNVRRVIRALEVYEVTGRRISELQESQPPPYRVLTIGLTVERTELYRRIDVRVDWMIENGLVEETRSLIERGYGCDLPSMSSLGYRQICMYLNGEINLPEAVNLIKTRTHRFARQQYTWFRLDDPSITWLPADERASGEAGGLVERFLEHEG